MGSLRHRLFQTREILTWLESIAGGTAVAVEQLWSTPKAILAAAMQQLAGRPILWVCGDAQEEALFADLEQMQLPVIIEIPAWETLPGDGIAPSADLLGRRYQGLKALRAAQQPPLILLSVQSLLQRLLVPQELDQGLLEVQPGQAILFEELEAHIAKLGYRKVTVVSDKGEYAIRGGLIDIYPITEADPYRLEFWGDEVAEIRAFDIASQKSLRTTQSLSITPAQELELLKDKERLATLFDYLPKDTIIVWDDLAALEDQWVSIAEQPGCHSPLMQSWQELHQRTTQYQQIFIAQQPLEQLSHLTYPAMGTIGFEWSGLSIEARHYKHGFAKIDSYLESNDDLPAALQLLTAAHAASRMGAEGWILSQGEQEERQLNEWLDAIGSDSQAQLHKTVGRLSESFALPQESFLVLSTADLMAQKPVRRLIQRASHHVPLHDFHDIRPGELVVHMHQGIGRFLGIEQISQNGAPASDFLVVEYAEGSKLYVPGHQAHLITRYLSLGETEPTFHTLGGKKWRKQREAVEHSIAGYAQQLLDLHARRVVQGGYSYPADGELMKAFARAFPYQETDDQRLAIEAVSQDMCSPKAMDRLICGDVGYGKTEIAMRAAFKAVADGNRQVVVLVPTTVLAMQHADNFKARMAGFPVRIATLTRMMTAKRQRETLQRVADGEVDILIGTHRLLSKDVTFHNLGLLIIDEEQRFGVKAKEHLRNLKVGVDTLTMSATPIPRTLHFSLVGARDMSVIATPPQDRVPIKSVLAEYNEPVIRSALLRELARQGQAYYIHNRVESIGSCAERLKRLVPQARIAVAHGQMASESLDQVFHDFRNGHIDVLVATTIVENGLDIPRANTILIERADAFGLAELYQLRGRVGRWNRAAYAYLLVAANRRLDEVSQRRLQALLENSGGGGGLKLAMRDLEIRGAGDLLGTEQSGHVGTVGYYLYAKLLKKATRRLQGDIFAAASECKLETALEAYIPEDYVPDATLRMELYQRLGEALSVATLKELQDELTDRFGRMPIAVRWLLALSRVRIAAAQHSLSGIKITSKQMTLERTVDGKAIKQALSISMPSDPEGAATMLEGLLEQLPNHNLPSKHSKLAAKALKVNVIKR